MRRILERVAEAIASTSADLRTYRKVKPEFEETGGRMLQEWEKGVEHSLGRE